MSEAAASAVAEPVLDTSTETSADESSTENVADSEKETESSTNDGESSTSSAEDEAENEGMVSGEAKPKSTKKKLKIDGEELELDEDEIIRRAQKASSADKRYKEAKAMHDEAMEFAKALRENPLKVLIESGLYKDNSQLADAVLEYLKGQEAEANLSEDEKAYRQKEADIEAREEALKQRETEAYMAEYQRTLPEALKTAGLPVNTRTIAALCHVVERALDNAPDGKVDLNDAAKEVRSYFVTLIRAVTEGISDDNLFEFLSDTLIDRANKVRSTRNKGKKPAAVEAPASKEEEFEETRLIREQLKRL